MSSILWFSLVMFISPYSYRASAATTFSIIRRILSFNFSSRSVAFSAEISSCFMFSPTASSSCSTSFSQLSTLSCPLALILLDTQLPGQLIKLLLVVAGHGGLPEGLVKLLNLDLIPHGLGFKVLDLLQNAISLLGCHGQFGDGVGKGGVSLLGFLLHQHDTPGKGTDFLFSILEGLQLFLQGAKGLGQFVVGFVKLDLVALDLLAQISDVSLMLVDGLVGLLGVSLKLGNGGVQRVGL